MARLTVIRRGSLLYTLAATIEIYAEKTGDYSVVLVPILGTTETAPRKVYRQAEHTLARLAEAVEDPPRPRIRGLHVDFSEWIEDLSPHVDALGLALGIVDAEKVRASSTSSTPTVSPSCGLSSFRPV